MLSVENLSKKLDNFCIESATLSIPSGSYAMILGQSGAGKTTLLNLLCGIVKPDSGKITWHGVPLNTKQVDKPVLSVVFQSNNLFPHLSVKQNIEFPLHFQKLSKSEKNKRLEDAIYATQTQGLLKKYPGELSGGELQRASLARVLAIDSEIIFLDEPLSSIDVESKEPLIELLRSIHQTGKTIIHITHNVEETFRLATYLVIMNSGAVVQQGYPNDVIQHPRNKFVAQMFGYHNFFDSFELINQGIIEAFNIKTDTLPLVIHPSQLDISTEFYPNSIKTVIREISRTLNGYYIKVSSTPELIVFIGLGHPLLKHSPCSGMECYIFFKY